MGFFLLTIYKIFVFQTETEISKKLKKTKKKISYGKAEKKS